MNILNNLISRVESKMSDGVVLIDKPAEMTSFDVVRALKAILKGKKIGHAGTLDPLATGLLPICIGHATKLSQFIMAGLKEYRGVMVLGKRTDTFDGHGRVIEEREVGEIAIEEARKVAKAFTGKMEQSPPPFSAVKHKGKPLYYFARKGIVIQKDPREIFVQLFEITNLRQGRLVDFRVVCTKGTYIRSLVDEFGKALSTGAYLSELQRTRVGPFSLDMAYSLDEAIEMAQKGELGPLMLDTETVLSHIPSVEIDLGMAREITHGIPVDSGVLQGLLEKQGVEIEPYLPYLRLKTGSNGSSGRTVAVCHWPSPNGIQTKVKMAKVFSNIQ